MIKTKLLFIILAGSLTFFFVSCKNDSNDKDEKDVKPIAGPELEKINKDTDKLETTEHDAMLVFRPNGKPEYRPKNSKNDFRYSASGLKYKFIERNSGNPSPEIGDIIVLSLSYKNENDSLIFNSYDIESELKMRVRAPSHPGGCIEEAYLIMNKGDSAVFIIDAEDFYQYTQNRVFTPDYIKEGEKLTFYIRLKDVLTSEDFVNKHFDIYQHQLQKERSLIERFLMNVDIEPIRYNSGLVHITVEEGRGRRVEYGMDVEINYIASFIDGAPFDSSFDRDEIFRFKLGKDELIPGLQEGILNMNVGEFALLIIPFRLAYGDEKYGQIPPFSTLIFEIEVVNAK